MGISRLDERKNIGENLKLGLRNANHSKNRKKEKKTKGVSMKS
jgi:hypothetical protein